MNRRDFVCGMAAGAAAGMGPAMSASTAEAARRFREMPRPGPDIVGEGRFPPNFWWGAATASYQVEGAVKDDGRKPSIWDTFSHTPGKTFNGDTGDVACDHYHRYAEDVKLMADLGVKHYRFSIAWPRIIPDGRGPVNEKGVDFYRRLADALLKHGITPHATLYHWDCPQTLEDRYGSWRSREIAADFAAYAEATVKRLGDRITYWMTTNEISCFAHGCGYGVNRPGQHAPGLVVKSPKEHWQITHHALLAHGRAVQAIRAASPQKCNVALAENYHSFVPVIETPEHIEAARRAFVTREVNAGILVPILTGQYNPQWLQEMGANAPAIAQGDMETIYQPLDSLGFNCYCGEYVRAADNAHGYEVLHTSDHYPKMNMPWLNIVPEAIYWGVRLVSEALGRRELPIFISENGCAGEDVMNAHGEVLDTDRVMYLRSYLRNVHRAVAEGYPLVGYFPWSLMDNFEWACGYAKRFGLTYVDYQTQKRTPKLSYRWYQQVIRGNRLV